MSQSIVARMSNVSGALPVTVKTVSAVCVMIEAVLRGVWSTSRVITVPGKRVGS